MIQKICPICDQVMKGSHYCRNCKSWVKHPYVREVNYYLNERHPQKETGCTFHSSPSSADASPPGRVVNTSGWVLQGQPLENRGNSQEDCLEQTGKGEQTKNHGVIWVAAAIALMVTAGSFLRMGLGAIGEGIRQESSMNQLLEFGEQVNPSELEWDYKEKDEEDYQEDDYEDFWSEKEYQELTDEEALEIGIECSGDGHFDISGKAFEESIRQFMEDQGLMIDKDEEYSYNCQYCDLEGNVVRTYFSTYVSLNLEGEDKYEYVELDFDTVTGALHSVDLVMEDKERVIKILEGICEILGEECNLPWRNWVENIKENLPGDIEEEDGYDYMTEDIWLWGYFYGDYYVVTFDAIE
ncbi:MAG: hypothetical protein HFG54_09125 [Lachnospiraceae bacterium]|nr:hypothetical protein [Lachnospiraceae bacterium]